MINGVNDAPGSPWIGELSIRVTFGGGRILKELMEMDGWEVVDWTDGVVTVTRAGLGTGVIGTLRFVVERLGRRCASESWTTTSWCDPITTESQEPITTELAGCVSYTGTLEEEDAGATSKVAGLLKAGDRDANSLNPIGGFESR